MLLELRFNNFRMLKNENILSFSADTRIKRLMSNTSSVLNRNVLKSLSLYGQNNIGKSNIVALFGLIKALMSGQENLVFNRNLFNDSPISSISLIYKTDVDESWMQYSFSYNSYSFEIVNERLSEVKFYDSGEPNFKTIYVKDNIRKIYEMFGEDVAEIMDLIPNKKPFIFSINLANEKYSSLKKYQDSFISFSNSIEIIQMFNIPIEKTVNVLKSNDQRKKDFIVSFVKDADLSVGNFFYNENVQFLDEGNNPINEEALKSVGQVEQFKLFTKYGDKDVPSFIFDSTGTKKIEAIASYIYESIIEGKLLVVDELDNGLHFKLSRAILSAFNSFKNTNGQLVFTAHDVELITCKHMMRKDQIYFALRDENLTSKLFCLRHYSVENGGPRTAEDLLKHYNRNEFGYVPAPNFLKVLNRY